jgi:hypothetical protein
LFALLISFASPELALATPATAIAEEANNAIFHDFFI